MDQRYYAAKKRTIQSAYNKQLLDHGLFDYGVCNPAGPEGITFCIDPFLDRADVQIVCETDPLLRAKLIKALGFSSYQDNNVRVAGRQHCDIFIAAAEVANLKAVANKTVFIDYDMEQTIRKLWKEREKQIAKVFESSALKLAIRLTTSLRIDKTVCLSYYDKLLKLATETGWYIEEQYAESYNDNAPMFTAQIIFS